MTHQSESRASDECALTAMHDRLLDWLRNCALPLWDRHGVDRQSGGYFETLTIDSKSNALIAAGTIRRGRVLARQIYTFDVGQRIGWQPHLESPRDHGRDYLFAHLHDGDGGFHTAVDAANRQSLEPFSLYEHAFYLFALARLTGQAAGRHPVDATAERCLQRLRAEFGKPNGGFEESVPQTLPLKSNPHMHLLEAALAWIDVSDVSTQSQWIALAREIVGLCLTRFVDARTGALREYFDGDWQPMAGDSGRIIEPGHQFEWAWLLLTWSGTTFVTAAQRQEALEAATRLMEIAERWGVDEVRGVAINELWDDMSIKDSAAKIWPQTERVKAWCARLSCSINGDDTAFIRRKLLDAGRGLARFFLTEPAGLWHEVCSPDGTFIPGPTKASSFYHIVGAIDVLRHTLGATRRTAETP